MVWKGYRREWQFSEYSILYGFDFWEHVNSLNLRNEIKVIWIYYPKIKLNQKCLFSATQKANGEVKQTKWTLLFVKWLS